MATSCNPSYYFTSNACKVCAPSTTLACPNECLSAGYWGNATSCTACTGSSSTACNSACLLQGWYSGSVVNSDTTTNSCN